MIFNFLSSLIPLPVPSPLRVHGWVISVFKQEVKLALTLLPTLVSICSLLNSQHEAIKACTQHPRCSRCAQKKWGGGGGNQTHFSARQSQDEQSWNAELELRVTPASILSSGVGGEEEEKVWRISTGGRGVKLLSSLRPHLFYLPID